MESLKDRGILLWGCGERGEMAMTMFPWLPVRAAVDGDPTKQGKTWHGVEVISREAYLERYAELPVLVTPDRPEGVVSCLEAHGRHRFWLLRDLMQAREGAGFAIEAGRDEQDAIWAQQKWQLMAAIYEAQASRWHCIEKQYFELRFLHGKRKRHMGEILALLGKAKHPALTVRTATICAPFLELLNVPLTFVTFGDLPKETDLLIIHGLSMKDEILQAALQAEAREIPIIFTEDGFLRSIEPYDGELRFATSHAIQLDMGGLYIHADSPSLLEESMNSEKVPRNEEIRRVHQLVQKIRQERLTKYNHQQVTGARLGSLGREKVLVVDQVYGDKSIAYGWATDETFMEMYRKAVEENPDADIYVKAHPVPSKGHFGSVREGGRIHLLTEPMNPIELIEQMDKVYVCTSQLGFEAAFCGKEVHTFGMPFYAGWGFTVDAQPNPNRHRKRTVEEAFYFAYIVCTVYVSYKTHGICSIEQAIEELLELRNAYWRRNDGTGKKGWKDGDAAKSERAGAGL